MLDARRQEEARKRIEKALRNARYYERQARAEQAKAETLGRTWGIDWQYEADGTVTYVTVDPLDSMPPSV